MKKENSKNKQTKTVHTTDSKSEIAKREEEILKFWLDNDIFKSSVERPAGNPPKGEFVFYDGPPFATGLPHYGHILPSTIKDVIPRFWTMRGYRVARRWGWDCHGLPIENIIEKKLGLENKRQIEEYGIKHFNNAARDAVLEYAEDWKRIIPRMGRWVDMENDYKSMDSTYTESVWWVFKSLYDKGLVYQGFKSMHLCGRCGTTLSNFEVNLGYKDTKDIAVTVKLPLLSVGGKETDTSLLVWTTTPWTLPGNMAVAVNENITYVTVGLETEVGKYEKWILAKDRLSQISSYEYKVLHEQKGSELVGKSYRPPFSYWVNEDIKGKEEAWKIYHADYVEVGEEGTGAVHLAPAYGEEDLALAQIYGIPVVHHVDEEGRFLPVVTDWSGRLVKPADTDGEGSRLEIDIEIIKYLKGAGKLVDKHNIKHSYPHCWRCHTPLLNYASNSWFVGVTKIKDDLLAVNQVINWIPDYVGKNRFGKWLAGARDWAVSRQRYWGAPLPIWKNEHTGSVRVFGSISELMSFVPKSGNSFLLMRHGESVSNVKKYASSDLYDENPLTSEGKKQVELTAEKLKSAGIDRIIYSPYQRTRETANLVASVLGLSEEQMVEDVRLSEIRFGEFEGRPNKEYQKFITTCPDGAIWCDETPSGGESWSDVKRRVGSFIYDIDKQYAGETILIVSHNSPLRMLEVVAKGQSLAGGVFDHDADGARYENAEFREFEFTPLPHNEEYELDLHRPYIDEFELRDTDGTKLKRISDVFDCWFESGSMPYGQVHYPFGQRGEVGLSYPADFIAESIDQTRGWFYSMLVLGVALFGRSPYRNVITNGLVLAEDGRKMSKSLKNYPDPMDLADRVGVDSMRYYLLSSPVIRGEDINFSEKEVAEQARKNIGRLHNVLAMYQLYENGTAPSIDSNHILDRWIINRVHELNTLVTDGLERYELDKAFRPIATFIDDLSVWYLRRSRDRLKMSEGVDRDESLSTLRYVLRTLSLTMAPIMPFYADYLWQQVRLKDDAISVHLAEWPKGYTVDLAILADMKLVRKVVSLTLEARVEAGIKVRQPLSELIINGEEFTFSEEFDQTILEEVNVKSLERDDLKDGNAIILDTNITEELKVEGIARELIRSIQQERKKMGLSPHDRVILTVNTDSWSILETYAEQVRTITGATSIGIDKDLTDASVVEIEDIKYVYHVESVPGSMVDNR